MVGQPDTHKKKSCCYLMHEIFTVFWWAFEALKKLIMSCFISFLEAFLLASRRAFLQPKAELLLKVPPRIMSMWMILSRLTCELFQSLKELAIGSLIFEKSKRIPGNLITDYVYNLRSFMVWKIIKRASSCLTERLIEKEVNEISSSNWS